MIGIIKKFCIALHLLVFSFATIIVSAQTSNSISLEEKAVIYFCQNVHNIDRNLLDYKIRFNNYTTGKASNIFYIADCEEDISLIHNHIPNETYLDSIDVVNKSKKQERRKISYDCKFLKRMVVAPFNKRIYRLYVYNAIEYKNRYFVELILRNKHTETWVICVKFDKENLEPINHCVSFFIY